MIKLLSDIGRFVHKIMVFYSQSVESNHEGAAEWSKRNSLSTNFSKSLRWQNFIFLFVAGCINAFGVNIFLAPVGLYDSGISGTSILLSQITPDYLSLSVFLLILNVPLFPVRTEKSRGRPLPSILCLPSPCIRPRRGSSWMCFPWT